MNSEARAARTQTVPLLNLLWAGQSIALLMLRVSLALPFYLSGLTKWDGFLRLSDNAVFLFANEFKLHLFGRMIDFPFPGASAIASAVAEIVVPVLLVLGLATRFAAFTALGMTAVIQLVVPDGWLTYHLPWAAMALSILVFGPGAFSADRAIRNIAGRPAKS